MIGIAHGYARVTGKPMAAIVHNLVGLLHSTMGVYYAYVDEAPVIVLGANYGPHEDPLATLARPDCGAISIYAQGRAYHQVLKKKCKQL